MQELQKPMIYYIMTDEQFRHFQEAINRVERLLIYHDKVNDELLSVPQTMELFKCSRATLNNWRSKKVLIPKVVEGRIYYLKSDCLRALQGSEAQKGGKANG